MLEIWGQAHTARSTSKCVFLPKNIDDSGIGKLLGKERELQCKFYLFAM